MACDTPIWIKVKGVDTPVPCGKCAPCKLRRVNEWVFRIMWEEQNNSISSHFVTLTYDTDHVPLSPHGFMSLRKKDFQDFVKRLRKITGIEGIKYYAVGEYGSQTNRPHYHAIILNCPDDDAYAKAWSLGGVQFGSVVVGTVTSDSVAYTMKYIQKESLRQKKYRHSRDDRELEFSLMSKGLGAGYCAAAAAYHKADLSRNYVTKEGGYRVAMPRYYRQKIFTESELDMQRDIICREVAEAQEKERRLFVGSREFPTYADRLEKERNGRIIKFNNMIKSRGKL